jgi:multiple sugar transport system permease protein
MVRSVTYVLLAVFGLGFAFPLLWTLSSSLQTWQELRSYTPHLLPAVPQWGNYPHLFRIQPMARWMANSFLVIALSLPGAILSATMTAYAFARFRYPGRDVWFLIMLGTMMIPAQVLMIPQYLLFHRFGWINTYYPLTVPSWLGGGAFTIFLLRQFIMSIPRDLDEAAVIDGAGPIRILWQVLAPVMKPALTTVAVLGFLGTWNDFFGPFIYLNDAKLFTAAVGLQFLSTAEMIESTREPRDHLLMAAAAVMSLPVILLFIMAQRYFVQGVVLTGIKM